MVKTLLVDTNRASYTIYKSLLDRGHQVWVVGISPAEPLAKICPNFTRLDYSDTEALGAFIEFEGFDFIVPGCTDVSYQTCAEIGQGRLPGIDTPTNTDFINDKSRFRALASSLEIPVPRVVDFAGAEDLPSVIVKPVDSFSGRGVSILQEPDAARLEEAHRDACAASRTGTALIEEFVTGRLYSHSAFLSRGAVVADFIVREDCTTNPFTVDTSCVEFDFDPDVLNRLRADAVRLFTHLGLVDGVIHTQFILSGDQYWLIEVTRRCPGDLYALLIEMSTGYPYGASYAAAFLGETPIPDSASTRRERIIRHTATSKDGETLWGFSFNRRVDLRGFVPIAPAGDFIKPSPFGRAAVMFLGSDSNEEHDSLYQSLLRHDLYRYDLNI